jgi:ribosomal protein S18 acetylase RimI-like enzyme
VNVIPASQEDLTSLYQLEHRTFFSDQLSLRSFVYFLKSKSAELWVAKSVPDNHPLMGYVLLLFRRNSRLARVYSIAVDEQFRGKGVAKSLLIKAEEIANHRGAEKIRLEVNTKNVPARQLYKALGYQEQKIKTGYYEDGGDALCLIKSLI